MTSTHRTVRLLASVTSEAEARLAAAGGADVIDAKDPASGALGALPHAVVSAIRAAVPATVPVSATIGDLPADPDIVVDAARAMAASGCTIVKVGLFPGGDLISVIRALGRHVAPRTALVAVLMADADVDVAVLPALGEAGFVGAMLDTAAKDGRTLLDHRGPAELRAFIDAARAAGVFSGLAGSLRVEQVPELLALAPDVLGFRGALCRAGDRTRALDGAALAAVRSAIPQDGSSGKPGSSPPPLWGRSGAGGPQTPAVRLPPTPEPSPREEEHGNLPLGSTLALTL